MSMALDKNSAVDIDGDPLLYLATAVDEACGFREGRPRLKSWKPRERPMVILILCIFRPPFSSWAVDIAN